MSRTCLCFKKFKKRPEVCSWRLCALLFSFCRREAVPMHMGELRLALRSIRRAHQTLPETHRGQTLQVHRLQPLLLTLGPFGSAHEASPELNQIYLHIQTHSISHKETAAWTNQLYKSQKENQNHPPSALVFNFTSCPKIELKVAPHVKFTRGHTPA